MEEPTSPRRASLSQVSLVSKKRRMDELKRRLSSPLLRLSDKPKEKTKIFGTHLRNVPLSRLARIGLNGNDELIPSLVLYILDALRSDTTTFSETGIFRTAGPASRVEQLVQMLDEGRELNLKKETRDTNADLLKLYFRNLPEPLFTFKLYGHWAAAVDGKHNVLEELRHCISALPAENREIARHLFFFFVELTNSSHKTKMDPMNIGIVWGPNLLWKENPATGAREIPVFAGEVVGLVIVNYFLLFSWPFIGQCVIKEAYSNEIQGIALKEGDVVNVFKKFPNDYWVGLFNDQVVSFPSTVSMEIRAIVPPTPPKIEPAEEKKEEKDKAAELCKSEPSKSETERQGSEGVTRSPDLSHRKVKRRGMHTRNHSEKQKKVEQLERELEALRGNIKHLERQIQGKEELMNWHGDRANSERELKRSFSVL